MPADVAITSLFRPILRTPVLDSDSQIRDTTSGHERYGKGSKAFPKRTRKRVGPSNSNSNIHTKRSAMIPNLGRKRQLQNPSTTHSVGACVLQTAVVVERENARKKCLHTYRRRLASISISMSMSVSGEEQPRKPWR